LGKLSLRLSGALRSVRAATAESSTACLPVPRVDGQTTTGDSEVDAYARGLRERRDEILAALSALMGAGGGSGGARRGKGARKDAAAPPADAPEGEGGDDGGLF
jgi:hypothetical protein